MSKILKVKGFESNGNVMQPKKFVVYISNDIRGKTISISTDDKMFSIPFEPIEPYLK